MSDRRIHPNDLDRTIGAGGIRMEDAYVEERRDIPLKAKYRASRGKHSQWGVGGDRKGVAKIPQRRNHTEPTRRRVLHVGPTGRRSWEWEQL